MKTAEQINKLIEDYSRSNKKYIYFDYNQNTIIFFCIAGNILNADEQCRDAGHNPYLMFIGTRIESQI
jgi:hypothetical protein